LDFFLSLGKTTMDICLAKATRVLIASATLLAALTLGACTTTPHRVVVPAQEMKLAELVDQRVEFTGVVQQGDGDLGDFITISGNRVFLDILQTGNLSGQRATVTGWLRHFKPPTAADCADADGCKDANKPEHYWIEDPKFKASAPAP
jgi:hypothetical protein